MQATRPSLPVPAHQTATVRNSFLVAAAVAALLTPALSSPVRAQGALPPETAAAVSPVELEEVVVTAQRREQALSDVPTSITVVSAQAIEDYQINGLADYTALSPNVGFFSAGDPFDLDLSFRGVSNLGGAVNSVAVYVDELNITPGNVTRTNDPRLADIERIEILRGPQGTSFGRNVLGGGISITTKKPSQTLGGNVEVDYGRFDTVMARGSINVPFSETVAMRASAYYEESAGFIRSVGPARAANDSEGYGARIALRATPNDSVTFDVTLQHSDAKQGLPSAVPNGELAEFYSGSFGPGILDPEGDYAVLGFFPNNTRRVAVDRPIEFENETTMATARLEIKQSDLRWVFNAGYITNEAANRGDGDYTSASHFFDEGAGELDSFSVEARLESARDTRGGGFRWLVGALYASDENVQRNLRQLDAAFFNFLGVPLAFLPPLPLPITNETRGIDIDSLGVFADADWTSATGRLTIGAGLRYSRDKVQESFDGRAVFDFSVFDFITNGTANGGETFNAVTPKVSLLYRLTDDINFYSTIARGTKPGGFNLGALDNPALPTTYDSESALNYEVGLKGAMGRQFSFTAAAFYTDWKDLQLETLFVASGLDATILTLNAGDASAFGAEVDFAWRPSENFAINGGAGWLDAEIGDNVTDVDSFGNPVDISGNRLPITSRFSANLAAQWDFTIANDTGAFLRAEYSYRGDQFSGQLNSREPNDLSPSYDVLNVRLGIERNGLRIVAYGENIADGDQSIGFRTGSGGSGLGGLMPTILPSSYGLRVSKEF
jgi:iron complex outermembrane recepter protein